MRLFDWISLYSILVYLIKVLKETLAWNNSLNAYAKFSKKLAFLTQWYAHVRTCAYQGVKVVVF